MKLVKLVKVSSQERGCLETPANTLKFSGDVLCVFFLHFRCMKNTVGPILDNETCEMKQ